MTLAQILTNVTDIFGEVMIMLQHVAAAIVGGTVGSGEAAVEYAGSPLILLFVLIPLIFLGVNMFRRLLNL